MNCGSPLLLCVAASKLTTLAHKAALSPFSLAGHLNFDNKISLAERDTPAQKSTKERKQLEDEWELKY